jgi:hypothetical protein
MNRLLKDVEEEKEPGERVERASDGAREAPETGVKFASESQAEAGYGCRRRRIVPPLAGDLHRGRTIVYSLFLSSVPVVLPPWK